MTWRCYVNSGVCQILNPYLAEILVTNLLKNALLHTETHLKTRNAGSPLPFPTEQLFGRFVKNPARPESTGLGLALVKQIAERCGMTVTYAYDEKTRLHEFTRLLTPA